jgi:hypothetical protein
VPVVLIMSNIFRIYFATRDDVGKSRITYLDVNADNPAEIINVKNTPVLDLGSTGSFDDCGVMPSWVVPRDGKIYLYYIGWNVRNTIPYHNSIGVAVSSDGGDNFNRVFEGPIIDRTHLEPFFSGSSCVIYDEGKWKNWYLSCTEWREINNKMEPRYHIKYAESDDGFLWKRKGVVAIDYKNNDEAGIVKASVIKMKDRYLMWYSYRNFMNYRVDNNNSYKIGYAESDDGVLWVRMDHLVNLEVSADGWDSGMQCYPHVLNFKDKLIMFYNGNGFGDSGFGYAELFHG